MSVLKSISMMAFAAVALVATVEPAAAQTSRPWETAAPVIETEEGDVPDGGMPRYIRPETPQERKERIGIDEDPGINPDPKTVYRRFGSNYTIQRFDRRWVKYTDRPGFVRPHPNVNFTEEMYQENDKWVWVWIAESTLERPSRDERKEAAKYTEYKPEMVTYLGKIRGDFEPLDPPKSDKVVTFEESSQGLPTSGSFRNSLAVADMNGDGFADLVVPSQRGSDSGTPSIFLGDGKGKWSRWNIRWPSKINYGTAVAADFNKDKKMDIAFGVHLSGLVILLGDGKGAFREVERITNFPTRRIVATDIDKDGWVDVAALYEGPVARGQELRGKGFSNFRAFLNRKKGEEWAGTNIAGAKEGISGDWLKVADFNGDGRPDFVGSNMYFNSTHTHYLSEGEERYKPVFDLTAEIIPARGTYHAVTVGRFGSKKFDDSVVASVRTWPDKLDPKLVPPPPLMEVIGLDRISFVDGAPKRTPIVRYGDDRPIYGLSNGDFDGDGSLDLIYTRHNPRGAVLLLGDGKGGFTKATIEGMVLPPQRNYDITVADVNNDKRPDVILMYETESTTAMARKNGRIQVFLNRGAK